MKVRIRRSSSILDAIRSPKRRNVLWASAMVLGTLGACNQAADIEPGQLQPPRDCTSINDCHMPCRTARSCTDGRCIFENDPQGQLAPMQNNGDCTVVVCDGQGSLRLDPDPTDIEDDHNPCTKDTCVGTSPRHDLLHEFFCYPGPSKTRNVGACRDGIIYCDANGKPIGKCEGAILPTEETCATQVDDDCDGATNEGGTACTCMPGTTASCYTGAANTVDVGPCHAGIQTCLSDGTGYGPCIGDLTPVPETCDAASVDEDCDGKINEEGENCQCGDGVVQKELGEECDDSNDNAQDSCVNCRLPFCGDGYLQTDLDEECDDGNTDPTDECTASCVPARCGDGIVQPLIAEGCDDGNTLDGDGCPANCQPHVVGVAAGIEHTCAVFDDGRVKCWGGNTVGQLGLGDTQARGSAPNQMGYHLPIVDLGQTTVSLAGGSMHTCALFDTGQVKCWGANQFGQLGIGDTNARGDQADEMGNALPFVNLGETALAITAGSAHSCALLISGSVKCWGYGYFGQLGRESRENIGGQPNEAIEAISLGTGRTAMAISAGQYHTCALLDDGSVKCWGSNEFGQLGQGDTQDRGDGPGEMGDALPAIALGAGVKISRIASGAGHVCATLDDGQMKCWGAGYFGQLGTGDDSNRGDNAEEMQMLSPIDFGTPQKVLTFALGANHVCVKLEDGMLRCFGRGSYGQLGQGTSNWIGNLPGQIAMMSPIDIDMIEIPEALASGSDHTCAIITNGRLKCWGRNDHGQLGLGDQNARGDTIDEMGALLPIVKVW